MIYSIVKPHGLIYDLQGYTPKYDVTKGNIIKLLICRSCDVVNYNFSVNKDQLPLARFCKNLLWNDHLNELPMI